jgi:threonyl-tRNA synthetase
MSINSNSTNLQLDTKRHSFAHLMAAAVGQMFPEAQYGVGPVIETGCYYDFVLPRNLIPEDLPLLENHIKDLLKRDLRFKVQELSLEEAILHFNNAKQPLKVELLENLRDRGTTSMSEEEKADFGGVSTENKLTNLLLESQKTGKEIYIDCVIFNEQGQVFVQKRSADRKKFPNCWELVGGGVEENETFEQAARRELKEELNFDLMEIVDYLEPFDYILPEAMRKENENINHRIIPLIVKVKDYSNPVLEAGKAVDYTWVDKNNLDITLNGNNTYTFDTISKVLELKNNNLPTITIYRIVDEKTGEVVFEDLCKGPHVAGVRRINTQNSEKIETENTQKAEVDNSPLEGWQPKVDGVDLQKNSSLPEWKTRSLFPFWNLPKNKELENNAKELRQAGVLSETIFWQAINNKEILKYDIDRQAIIGNYIVDFFIPELGLVFEIDGESHDFKGEQDVQRENYLMSLNLEIIHFADIEVKKAMDQVGGSVMGAIKNRERKLMENPAWTPPRQPAVATPQEGNYDTAKGQGVSAELKQTIETYNNNLDKYIAKANFAVDGIKKNWIDETLQKLNKDSAILEIGSGLGIDADYIESNGFKVNRTDYSQSFIDYQKSKGKEIGQYNALGKATKKQYDLVFADAVLLHFNDQEFDNALININQSLAENGLFAFTLKKGEGSQMIVDKMESPRYFKFWQKDELENILAQKGFETEVVLEDDNWLMVIAKKVKSLASTEPLNLQNMGFKLDKFSASYWRGDQARGINMQRLYALVFETKDELKTFVTQREEAKKRDHRVLGSSLKLFTISDLVGSGLPLLQPKGAIIRKLLEDYLWQLQKTTHDRVYTPHITKKALYEKSGHAGKYLDDMFSVYGGTSKEEFYVKPMNCPMHMQIFADNQFSYKDMPVRYFDPTTVYRDEKTGQLSGMTRVRSITQDDGHIFCRIGQIEEEFTGIVQTIRTFYKAFGMEPDWVSWSVRDSQQPEKYLGDPANWDIAEESIRKAAEVNGLTYKRVEGEAAFYGPKLDFMFKDCIGREWQLSTIQCDFVQPERFDLGFKNEAGEMERPVVIHRAISGSFERFMGIMIEHFAGKFPFWMSPEQIRILTINDEVLPFVDKIKAELDTVVLMQPLKYNELRYSLDDRMESLGKKIRDSKLDKVPMFIVVGMKDVEDGIVSIEYAGESVKVPLGGVKAWMENIKN